MILRSFGAFVLFLAVALPASAADGPPPPYDGDTMYVAPGPDTPACSRLRWGKWEAVRILGIDTPEMDGECAAEEAQARAARLRLIELLGSGEVSLRRDGCDRYERTLARVFVNQTDVAAALISEGLGRAYDGGRRAGWCADADQSAASDAPIPRPNPGRK
ncbi:thermonuclease family protein [Amorphus orientalis]|uniref:Endonuclease YncB(Thermonuclease family) n=1 Tax=Amorphus orientalis TaxID=649198 RepID=A0AAE3VMK5_9HYPH|nr:thermonuclease family protein [Amorphus orientalis]MDQ0314828.1 endonuclease YncB(thermonuclease family) [Amorphus orientalis]